MVRRSVVLSLLVFCSSPVHAQIDQKIWTRLAGSGALDEGYGAAADPSGNGIIAGGTQGSLFGANQGRYDLFVGKYDTGGNLLWGRQRGTAERDFAFGVTTDASGNIYATGYTGAALDGGPYAGNWDIFLMKYGPTGDWLWTKQIGTGQDDEGYAVTRDASGHIYLTGYVRGDLHGQTRVGSADVVICKYSPDGTRQWTRLFGSTEIDQAWGIACDASANVFVTGYCQGSIEGNPYLDNGDLFLAKYDTNGNRLWLRQWGTWNKEHGYCLATDAGGNVYLSGYTTGPLYGSQMGNRDAFLAKFDASGNELWGRQYGTSGHDQGWAVAMGADGNVYTAGETGGPLDENTHQGGLDVFLAKYDSWGMRLWTAQVGTAADDWARGAATATGGVTFLAGITGGDLDGNPNQGGTDAFAMKFAPAVPPAEPTDAVADPATICLGDTSQLSATPGSGGDTVEWFTDSCGGTAVEGGESPTVSPSVTTPYYARTKNSVTGLTSSTCASVTVPVNTPVTQADLNQDCDVDEDDYNLFAACVSGPAVPFAEGCENSDFNNDGDVDQSDFGVLQRCFSGSGNLPDPNCAE